jgi:hypothetical protein
MDGADVQATGSPAPSFGMSAMPGAGRPSYLGFQASFRGSSGQSVNN